MMGLKRSQIASYGQPIADCLIKQLEMVSAEPEDLSFSAIPNPLKGAKLKRYKTLRSALSSLAEKNNIPSSLLSGKKMIETMVRRVENDNIRVLPDDMADWKRTMILPVWDQWVAENYAN